MTRRSPLIAALALTLAASACGGSSGADTAVATLSTDESAAVEDQTAGEATEADAQESALAFTECLRGEGLDVADPTFDANGELNGGLFGPDSGIGPGAEGFAEAMEVCGDLLEGAVFGGGGGRGGGFDTGAIEEASLAFTECLRDEGLEVDDLTLGGGPGAGGGGFGAGGPAADGVPPEDGPAAGRGFGGGGVGDRMAAVLGLDVDDPAVEAALETCEPLLEGAFQAPLGGEDA